MATLPRYRIGADENGLGPRLGPMIVTACLARVTEEGARFASKKPRGKLGERLGDSKALIAHGDVALGEAWARALVRRGAGRAIDVAEPVSPDALVHAIALEDRDVLRAPCPNHVASQCWSAAGEAFAAEDALVRTIEGDLAKLDAKGVELVAVRSVILCSKRLNDGVDRGLNRFVLDLHAMERLILDLQRHAGADVHAVCGKVGGFKEYSDVFGPLGGRLHTVLEESQKKSSYVFPGVGEIAFVRDGDASDVLVAMASLVGKWMRDTLMARVVRFYREDAPELPDASGYHDPVTQAFVDATRLARKGKKVPESCFERRKVG